MKIPANVKLFTKWFMDHYEELEAELDRVDFEDLDEKISDVDSGRMTEADFGKKLKALLA